MVVILVPPSTGTRNTFTNCQNTGLSPPKVAILVANSTFSLFVGTFFETTSTLPPQHNAMHTTTEQRSCSSCTLRCSPPSSAEVVTVSPAAKRRKVMSHHVKPYNKMPFWSETHGRNQDTSRRSTMISPDVEMLEVPLLQRNGSDIVKVCTLLACPYWLFIVYSVIGTTVSTHKSTGTWYISF